MSTDKIHIECSDNDCTHFTDQDIMLPLGDCPYCGSRMILDEDFLQDDGLEIEFELWDDADEVEIMLLVGPDDSE